MFDLVFQETAFLPISYLIGSNTTFFSEDELFYFGSYLDPIGIKDLRLRA
jgi:hypothetical protein